MEQQEMQEERRARNFVWAAAEQYGLEPLFLAYAPDGTADMYLNIIIGLSYKWYDAQKLKTFFHMLGGSRRNCIRGFCGSVWNRHYTKKNRRIGRHLRIFARNMHRKIWGGIVRLKNMN